MVEQLPVYQQIAGHYRSRINHGRLLPGERLPPVRVIAESWKVTRATVLKALQLLINEHLVETRGAGGTVVARLDTAPEPVRVAAALRGGRAVVVETATAAADDGLAEELAVAPGTIVRVVTLAYPSPHGPPGPQGEEGVQGAGGRA